MSDFDRLKNKYGTHERAASAMGISARTYFNWKRRNAEGAKLAPQIVAFIKQHINEGMNRESSRKKKTSN